MNHDAATVARRRKRKALLAGGTVLGLGAAVTLAAWTDDVWVSGSFAAGTFNVEGAVDAAGANWQEYATSSGPSSPGELQFTLNPTEMTPGDSVYAPLNLRIGPEPSEYDAAITLPTAPEGGALSDADQELFDALQLNLYNVSPKNCNDAVTGGDPLTGFDDANLSMTSTGTLLTLDGDMTPQGMCFKVTLPTEASTDVQGGQTGDLTWNFHAESIEPTP